MPDGEPLDEGSIEIDRARSARGSVADVPVRSPRRHGERRFVEPFRDALVVRINGSAEVVDPLGGRDAISVGILSTEDCEGKAGTKHRDAFDRPAAEYHAGCA